MVVTIEELSTIITKGQIFIDEPLKNHSTFKIGGKAKFLIYPCSINELINLVRFAKFRDEKVFVLGGGSNCLFSDNGFDGIVICLEKMKLATSCKNEILTLSAGERLSYALKLSCDNSLSGLEWAVGIPATIGGAVFMNAGAFGGQMSMVVNKVWALVNGKVKEFDNKACKFGYRSSIFQSLNCIILKVQFKLENLPKSQILANIAKTRKARFDSQPVEPSCGSVFKKSLLGPAGKIIDELGLKETTIGGAKISEKHANFIVNIGNAKASDVLKLIDYIQNEVNQKFNIKLETEVKFIGDDYENSRGLPYTQ